MEMPHPEYRREGMFFDESTFKLDLYRLLCCFYASNSFARLRDRSARDVAEAGHLAGRFEEFEIIHLLVSIAARARIIQDRERRALRRMGKTACGRLIPDLKHPRKAETLSWREACNKIIHAKRFNFDYRYQPRLPDDYPPVRPVLHLYGTYSGLDWKARLNVEAFVAVNAWLVQG